MQKQGFATDTARSGAAAAAKMRSGCDLIILDVDATGADRFSLLKEWRGNGVDGFVLVLANELTEMVDALNLGADDAMTKPYQRSELLARLRALARRRCMGKSSVVQVFDLEIDRAVRIVKRAGRPINLTRREYDLLHYLAARPGRVVSRIAIWGDLFDGKGSLTSNLIDVTIANIRKKVDRGFELPLILTCLGRGYMMRGNHAQEPAMSATSA